MPRNFGVRRNHFGDELFGGFDSAGPSWTWPLGIAAMAAALIAAVWIFT